MDASRCGTEVPPWTWCDDHQHGGYSGCSRSRPSVSTSPRTCSRCTAPANALRAHLAEFGIVAGQGRAGLRELLAVVADQEDRRLPPLARELLRALAEHLRALEERTAEVDRRLVAAARDGGACERL